MKKLLSVLSAILLVSLVLSSFSACSRLKKKKAAANTKRIETGTLSEPEHLDTESESSSLTQTEKPTEQEKPTESNSQTETPTESESETEKEPEPSLEFTSFGNGTCAVSGIGDISDIYLVIPERSPNGDIVISIGDKAFFENTTIKAVQIPSTVMDIGNMAFGGCLSLVYISVDQNNMMYSDKDGILYSKDGAKLILFPSASLASEIFISSGVTEISDMAFFSTPNLKFIKYGGTLSDWSKIKIGENNYGIYSSSLSFAVSE